MPIQKLQHPVFLIIALIFLQACGNEDGADENSCIDDISGAWDVTSFIPSSANCFELTTYQIGPGPYDNILSITMANGTRTLTGTGLINARCSEMTYLSLIHI